MNVSIEIEVDHLEFQRQEIHENYPAVELSSIRWYQLLKENAQRQSLPLIATHI